ncbi:unnamed protein product [Brachionus calyciflorus]|uniref:Battenin n=1 Tax=Brachionus calyciflorus TaxID=104777 RepID=A0A814DWT1_9BILA|nr:unnamed protein product [Brachionus calyciflorus]
MISAAHDLLKDDESYANNVTKKYTGKYDCNEISTGAVLLADVLPGLLMKIIFSAYSDKISYNKKFYLIIFTSSLSFLVVSQTPNDIKWLIFTGICSASISTSVGELTFLSLSTLYPTNMAFFPYVIGSGSSGLLSSFFYAGLASYLSPKRAILFMLFVPCIMSLAYFLMPESNSSYLKKSQYSALKLVTSKSEEDLAERNLVPFETMNLSDKFKLAKPLLKYMIPLFIIFYSEYLINQGLYELLYFKNDRFVKDHSSQYRWYNVCFRLGVFVSRLSLKIYPITFLPIFPIFQIINFVILFANVLYGFIPSIFIVFLITFWEGLIGGGCYVNALNLVSIEVPKIYREFSIGVTTIADTIGIALAGFTALPLHDAICRFGM